MLLSLLIILGFRISYTLWSNDYKGNEKFIYKNNLLINREIEEIFDISIELKGSERTIFVYPNHAIIYVLTKKNNPTKFNQFFIGYHNTTKEQKEVIWKLKRIDPLIVIHKKTFTDVENNYHLINNFIKNSTNVINSTKNFEIRELII